MIGTAAGVFSGALRGGRRHGDRAAADPLVRLRRARGDRHLARGDRRDRVLGVAVHGAYGNVDVGKGLLVGVPAIGGVLLGTSLQQRLSGRTVSLLFAALLVVVALDLIIRVSELAAILVGFLAGTVAGPDGRRRRDPVRAGADALPRPEPAATRRPRRCSRSSRSRSSAPGASTATATCGCATALVIGALSPVGVLIGAVVVEQRAGARARARVRGADPVRRGAARAPGACQPERAGSSSNTLRSASSARSMPGAVDVEVRDRAHAARVERRELDARAARARRTVATASSTSKITMLVSTVGGIDRDARRARRAPPRAGARSRGPSARRSTWWSSAYSAPAAMIPAWRIAPPIICL